ncbi:Hsp70 family protein [Myxococcota bacterium]|nr:Hsp70 family protein [Myxococcota bacterium]
MTSGELYVGIDLGTTNSTAAIFDGAHVTLVRSDAGAPLTPSVVRIDAKGQLVVGARARKWLESDPENTKGEFKRLMGTGQRIEFPASKTSKRPEELSAEILRSLREDVSAQTGMLPERAVISVPALFEVPQSSATAEAARLAGFERVELIQEPIASALAAGWSADDSTGAWLVYDYGGGTFDASLLETRDGLLRVVGHDGDNFLGGRDIDWAIVDWAIAELARTGARLSRAEPRHAAELRKLKLAAEEAKIELTRRTSTTLGASLTVDGASIPVELTLDRATLERLALPFVERTLEVCRRLLRAHGLTEGRLARVVLVGGPTVMPMLRDRVTAALAAPLAEGHDPMTLVAEGAALYAATARLDARPKARAAVSAPRRFWLQHPAMSADLTPHVIGRLVDGGSGPKPASVRLVRADGGFESTTAKLDAQGAFVLSVSLVPRRPNVFHLVVTAEDGARVQAEPTTLTIVQGLTIGDPPLSRSIGVALADDSVRVYFERGAPLPSRRTFVHRTVETVAKGAAESLLEIPIVQGELDRAHLCRRVGVLEIAGSELGATLPAGSEVEVTLELDRGGRLSARALVVPLGQVFEEVAHLLVPEATPDVLAATLEAMRSRIARIRSDAFRTGQTASLRRLGDVEVTFTMAAQEIEAAKGGDADAAQKAKRTLLDVDATLEEVELERRWPELDDDAKEKVAGAARWISAYGTPAEQKLFAEAQEAVGHAREHRDAVELQRQLRLVSDLRNTAFYRHPDAWRWMFEGAASEADDATDLPEARRLVTLGRKALDTGDVQALRHVTEKLWRLLPADAERRAQSFGSGVR